MVASFKSGAIEPPGLALRRLVWTWARRKFLDNWLRDVLVAFVPLIVYLAIQAVRGQVSEDVVVGLVALAVPVVALAAWHLVSAHAGVRALEQTRQARVWGELETERALREQREEALRDVRNSLDEYVQRLAELRGHLSEAQESWPSLELAWIRATNRGEDFQEWDRVRAELNAWNERTVSLLTAAGRDSGLDAFAPVPDDLTGQELFTQYRSRVEMLSRVFAGLPFSQLPRLGGN